MKRLMILGSVMFTVLTAVEPIWAQDTSTVRSTVQEEPGPTRLSDLGMHLNPQLGLSSFEYSGKTGSGKQKLAGGATVEFGEGIRKMETGLLIMQTGAVATLNSGQDEQINSTYLTLPMMAKLRILNMTSQAWYAKFGALSAFQLNSSNRGATNPIDVMASAGLAGRFVFSKTSDFIVEATYNRGLMEALKTSAATNYNQGFVILAGLSFKI